MLAGRRSGLPCKGQRQRAAKTFRASVTPACNQTSTVQRLSRDHFTEFAMATLLQLTRVLPDALSSAPPAWSAGLRRLFAVSPVVNRTWLVSCRIVSRRRAEYRTLACSRSTAVAGSAGALCIHYAWCTHHRGELHRQRRLQDATICRTKHRTLGWRPVQCPNGQRRPIRASSRRLCLRRTQTRTWRCA